MTGARWYLWFRDDDGHTIAVHGPYIHRMYAEQAMAALCEAEDRAMLGFDLKAPADLVRMAVLWHRVLVLDLNPDELAALG